MCVLKTKTKHPLILTEQDFTTLDVALLWIHNSPFSSYLFIYFLAWHTTFPLACSRQLTESTLCKTVAACHFRMAGNRVRHLFVTCYNNLIDNMRAASCWQMIVLGGQSKSGKWRTSNNGREVVRLVGSWSDLKELLFPLVNWRLVCSIANI